MHLESRSLDSDPLLNVELRNGGNRVVTAENSGRGRPTDVGSSLASAPVRSPVPERARKRAAYEGVRVDRCSSVVQWHECGLSESSPDLCFIGVASCDSWTN